MLPGGSPPTEEIVIGSREAPGANRIGEPANRHVKGRAFTMAVWLLAFRGIEDTQCGFKLFRGDVADQIFKRQRLDGFWFDVEVLLMARKMGLTIREQAIDWYYREGSSMTLLKGLGGFLDIARVRINWAIGRYRDLKSPCGDHNPPFENHDTSVINKNAQTVILRPKPKNLPAHSSPGLNPDNTPIVFAPSPSGSRMGGLAFSISVPIPS